MNSSWQITGRDSLKNSQLAFSIVSKVLWLSLRLGGESDPGGILVTSIGDSSLSSTFSKIGWSFVYQKVMARFMFLKNTGFKIIFIHYWIITISAKRYLHTERFISFLQSTQGKILQCIYILTKYEFCFLTYSQSTSWNKSFPCHVCERNFSAQRVHE